MSNKLVKEQAAAETTENNASEQAAAPAPEQKSTEQAATKAKMITIDWDAVKNSRIVKVGKFAAMIGLGYFLGRATAPVVQYGEIPPETVPQTPQIEDNSVTE